MSVRNGLLGVVAVLALAGVAAADPPVNPLVEGREPNPVAREFHEPASPMLGSAAPAVGHSSGGGTWSGAKTVFGMVLDRWTRPLATAAVWD